MTQSIGDIQAWGESLESSQPQEMSGRCGRALSPPNHARVQFRCGRCRALDMLHRIDSSVGLFYLDTDFLFPRDLCHT